MTKLSTMLAGNSSTTATGISSTVLEATMVLFSGRLSVARDVSMLAAVTEITAIRPEVVPTTLGDVK